MGSRKQRTQQKLERAKNSPIKPAVEPVKKQKELVAKPTKPVYTALYMVIGIVIIAFIFTVMFNTIITDICLNNDPSLQNNNEALRVAVELYISEHPVYYIIQQTVINVAGIIAMMILFGKIENDELPVIGLKNNGKKRIDIGMGILFAFLSSFVAFNILAAIGYVKMTGALVFDWTQLLWALYLIIMCIFEEMLFRGYALFKLKNIKPIYAIAITSVLFALYKGLPSTMFSTYITYIMMGILLSYTTIKLNTMWFSLAFRIMWTFTSAILLSINADVIPGIVENSGIKESFISGNQSGFENGLLAALILFICFIIAKTMITNRKSSKQRRLQKDGTIR